MIINYIFHKINSSKSHPYFYLSPHVYSFGDCAEEIQSGLIKAKHENKKLVILYPFDIPFIFKYKLTNRALFNIKSDLIVDQGKYTLMLSRALMTIIYMPLRVVGLMLRKFSRFNLQDRYHFPQIGFRDLWVPEKSINKFSLESVQEHNWSEKFSKKIDFTISLNGNVCDGYEQQKLGIPKNSWFVCLHIREGGFRNDRDRRDYRNSNILNCIPAIKEIISRGGWVVRMGDNTMKPLPSMENVIDYPFTKYKSDFMDLCLIRNCLFLIANQTGSFAVAKLFKKNVLLINMYEFLRYGPTNLRDRAITQHVYSKRDKRYLSIKELFSNDHEECIMSLTNECFLEKDYALTENTAGEISRAVIEYMDFLSKKNFSLTFKQKEFIEYIKIQYQRMLEVKRFSSPKAHCDEDEMIYRYRYAMAFESAQGTLCSDFLEENW
jgi:putative glycosyltransferase (TIGR04372 family)